MERESLLPADDNEVQAISLAMKFDTRRMEMYVRTLCVVPQTKRRVWKKAEAKPADVTFRPLAIFHRVFENTKLQTADIFYIQNLCT